MPKRLLARRRLLRRQPGPRRACPTVMPDLIGRRARKDFSQPGGSLALLGSLKLVERLMRTQEGELHQIGRVELPLKPPAHLPPGEEEHVLPVRLQNHT